MNEKTIKITNQILKSARNYLEAANYTEIITPRIVRASGACENVDTLFETSAQGEEKWFSKKRGYLCQTGQLYLEALVPKLGNVYCIGPSFRAEPKVDDRHLTEFQMLEIELPTNFDGLLSEIENIIESMALGLISDPDKIKKLNLKKKDVERLKNLPVHFARINYDDAIKLLNELGCQKEWGDDISSAEEQKIVEHFGGQPVFITRFPDPMWDFKKKIDVEKFFNMLPDKENPGRVLSADLILPYGGEAVGAAARVHEPETMIRRLKNSRMFKRLLEKGGNISDFGWYIEQLKNGGSVPHAGCGIGLARVVKWLMGESDIRNCVAFASNKESLI
jgi:asparaginyl-tRNA synthetase